MSLPTCRPQVCERPCHHARCPYEHGRAQNEFYRKVMQRRAFGPLPWAIELMAYVNYGWRPWGETGVSQAPESWTGEDTEQWNHAEHPTDNRHHQP